ncbi:MAG: hypothetical protein KBG20_06630 [Caldilineaceae bacterium]|nr:hypothetical protein [Caldilineaceae bacterium]MBP8121224.1 hypothetical protein [Caldilineaceae bacterium]MBP9071953.1 hypothetical protein [Caldilineaceae bacterium]
MTGAIYLMQDGQLIEMTETAYEAESLLQDLLAGHTKLLAGDQIDPADPRRWLLVGREVPILSESGDQFSLDHLFLDQDGVPTLVEVKRSTDHRIRREVVGQMLDYAANAAVYWPIGSLRTRFEVTTQQIGVDPVERLSELLQLESVDNEAIEAYWNQVQTNLEENRLRLLFVADQIPTQLRRIVEFLNEQMDRIEVLAIEVKQYQGGNAQTLVPRVMGQTIAAEHRKTTAIHPSRQWEESSFFEELAVKHGTAAVEVAHAILDWAKPRVTRIYWGRGSQSGSFVPIFHHKGVDHQLFAVWTYGTFEVYFQHFAKKAPFDAVEARRALLQRLTAIDGVVIPESAIASRPNVSLGTFQPESSQRSLLAAYDWVIEQIEAS